jgi:hypothetical protein
MKAPPFWPMAIVLTLFLTVVALAQTSNTAPLSIARQGYLFAGGKYSDIKGKKVINGQLYAEFQIPSKMNHPYPIVMVHGGRQSGSNFTGTPDLLRSSVSTCGRKRTFIRNGRARVNQATRSSTNLSLLSCQEFLTLRSSKW